MMDHWQLQEAKNRFSELVRGALRYGPQIVTKRGVETVVVMSVKDYQKLIRPPSDLVKFFRESPLRFSASRPRQGVSPLNHSPIPLSRRSALTPARLICGQR